MNFFLVVAQAPTKAQLLREENATFAIFNLAAWQDGGCPFISMELKVRGVAAPSSQPRRIIIPPDQFRDV